MARYVYLATSGSDAAWVKDNKFDCLNEMDRPQNYQYHALTLPQARIEKLTLMLKNDDVNFFIMKFDAAPPHKYHGQVQ